MKKLLKKSFVFVLSLALLLSMMTVLFACGDEEGDGSDKVMNLSLNPSVEFVLDKNNNVVSVSANNDEGNFIVANATFTGLTAEDAADLFLNVVKENGFLISGSVSTSENNLKIEVSGETAQNIYNSVKDSLEDKMTELSVSVNFANFDEIAKAEIEELVKECCKELDVEKITAMTEEELLATLKASREETKNLLSEELKEYYYQARYGEILKAKFEKLEELVNALPDALALIKTAFANGKKALEDAIDNINTTYETIFLAEDGAYRVAMDAFINAKKELLEGRLANVSETVKEQIEASLVVAQNALASAKSTADGFIATANLTLETAVNTVESALTTILSQIDMTVVDATIKTTKDGFKATFNAEFSVQIADVYWNDLKPAE